jgi:hypothetical protein
MRTQLRPWLRTAFWMQAIAFALCACTDHHDGGAENGDGGPGFGNNAGKARSGKLPADGPHCTVSQATAEVPVSSVDKVDLLFVVDNSGSMSEEQAALREQFPRLLSILASGDPGAGREKFPAAKSVHLGVVSTDLGLVGISDIDKCNGLGDDGIMQNEPRLQNCKASYPRFLTFEAGLNTPIEVANDLACVAQLGTDGCGFEQQLEVALKALWPSADSRIKFLGDASNFGVLGHGDTENQGFLRSDPVQGLSALAIIMVTDEEDCSSQSTEHLTPPAFLDPRNPADVELLKQGLNVRCNFNQQNLFEVSRYINGFKALRPGNENLVMFSAIIGVPPETVSEQALENLRLEDVASRNQFYQNILNHALMQPVVETNNTPDPADDSMRPSCNTARGLAFPPRRIVEVARGFGPNGIVQSICQQDLGPAFDAIVAMIAQQLGAVCLPRPLARSAAGVVGCDVIWELPSPGQAPTGVPTDCGEAGWPFLLPVDAGTDNEIARGGKRCKVAQLAVRDAAIVPTKVDDVTHDEGWYYDDFSEDVQQGCKTIPQQRIAFSPNAKPPTGVTVKLQCLNQALTVEPTADAIEDQPMAGDFCENVQVNGEILTGDAACVVRLANGSTDSSLFCHPGLKACVTRCTSDDDCPKLWSCDDSPATLAASDGRAHCTATCSAGKRSADARKVGARCLPYAIPESGFDPREAYVEFNTPDCGGGICIVHGLDGDPLQGCVPTQNKKCASPAEVERSVYCSCRCDAPEGYAQCACPDGFSCVTALTQGGPDVSGGYCVRNDSVTR